MALNIPTLIIRFHGIMTLSKMTLSILTLSINTLTIVSNVTLR